MTHGGDEGSRWPMVGKAIVLFALLGTGVGGWYNTLVEWPRAVSALHHLTSLGELAYGMSGLLAAWGVWGRHRWSVAAAAVWVAALTFVAAAAPIAYGGPDATVGSSVLAGGATFVVAGAVWWGVVALTTREG